MEKLSREAEKIMMDRFGKDSFKKIYAGEESIEKYLYDGFEEEAIQSLISQVKF